MVTSWLINSSIDIENREETVVSFSCEINIELLKNNMMKLIGSKGLVIWKRVFIADMKIYGK